MVLDVAKGAVAAVIAGVLGGTGEVLEAVILLAGGGAAAGWIYARILKPAAKAFGRTYEAVGALEELPAFMEQTQERFERGSEKMDELAATQARHGAVLAEVAARETAIVRDALRAGETVDLSDT